VKIENNLTVSSGMLLVVNVVVEIINILTPQKEEK